MKINTQLARRGMRVPEFRDFMKNEIGIKQESDLKKLAGCGDCWNTARFTPRTVAKINAKLAELKDRLKQPVKVYSRWFSDKKNLIKFIEDLPDGEILEFFAGYKH